MIASFRSIHCTAARRAESKYITTLNEARSRTHPAEVLRWQAMVSPGSICLYLAFLAYTTTVCAPFFPAAVPLAIRSPHFSMWYNCPTGAQPFSNSWPLFWNGVRLTDATCALLC